MILTSSWPHARVSRVRGTRAATRTGSYRRSVCAIASWDLQLPTAPRDASQDPPFSKVTPGSHPAARSRHISLSDWPGLVPKLNGAARASSFFMNYYKILRSPGGLVRGRIKRPSTNMNATHL